MALRESGGGPPDHGTSVAVELPCRLDSLAAARREVAKLESEIGRGLMARVRVVVTEIVSSCVWNGAGGAVVVEVSGEASPRPRRRR